MSLISWKKEFYRIPASQVSKGCALQHSLKKWAGLKWSNKKKHKVVLRGRYNLVDSSDNTISILGIESCALCVHFFGATEDCCLGCPLVKAGIKSCGDVDSPYSRFIDTGRTLLMIRALKKAQTKMRGKR